MKGNEENEEALHPERIANKIAQIIQIISENSWELDFSQNFPTSWKKN